MPNEENLSLLTQQNALVLGAVGDLVAGIVSEIGGNEISNAVNGQVLTGDLIRVLTNQEIVKALKA